MKWFEMPRVYPEIQIWGCLREPWQYVLSHNHHRDDWAASAQPINGSLITELGWNFKTREEAEAAIKRHFKEHIS